MVTRNVKKPKKYTMFRPRIRSRHPSHSALRKGVLELLPFRSIVRLGSTTELQVRNIARIECNSVESIKNASNKLLMKQKFREHDVTTAAWCTIDDILEINEDGVQLNPAGSGAGISFPIVAKHIYGSRGNGNYKVDSKEQLEEWMKGKTLKNYIFEKFYNYSREYRLHVTEDGCFYTCRKMLKEDTPENQRWFRNDSNSVWMLEENELFDKPVNWENVTEHSVKALKAVGLDIGAVDLKIQSRNDAKGNQREQPEFIVLEINSAPSFGELTTEKYIRQIPIVLRKKFKNHDSSSGTSL